MVLQLQQAKPQRVLLIPKWRDQDKIRRVYVYNVKLDRSGDDERILAAVET
jgi:hypothetical protein